MSQPENKPTQYFSHTLTLTHSSTTFPARLAYKTYGDSKSPAICLPSCYGGKLATTTPFLYSGTSAPFSPDKYFIIVVGLLGGGESSSPSNAPAPFSGPNFPHTTYADNINLQVALCKSLGVKKIFAYIGFSMGGQQAYHMASLHPDYVQRIVVLAGSARTSAHNWAFLEGPKAALVNSVDFERGHYTKPATRGTGAFGRVYCPWALSQAWFRERCWEKAGHATLEDYMRENWEKGLGAWDANDLLALLWTWQDGDISVYHSAEDGGDWVSTLQRVQAKCLVMPSRTDTYFPPEDSEVEVKHLRNAKLAVIESIWGHMAGGGGGTEEDIKFINETIGKWVKETS